MNYRRDDEITPQTTSAADVDTAAEERLKHFSRFLARGAVRAAEGRTPTRQNAGKQSLVSKTEQFADDPTDISEASGG